MHTYLDYAETVTERTSIIAIDSYDNVHAHLCRIRLIKLCGLWGRR